jgi:hypothetical protein
VCVSHTHRGTHAPSRTGTHRYRGKRRLSPSPPVGVHPLRLFAPHTLSVRSLSLCTKGLQQLKVLEAPPLCDAIHGGRPVPVIRRLVHRCHCCCCSCCSWRPCRRRRRYGWCGCGCGCGCSGHIIAGVVGGGGGGDGGGAGPRGGGRVPVDCRYCVIVRHAHADRDTTTLYPHQGCVSRQCVCVCAGACVRVCECALPPYLCVSTGVKSDRIRQVNGSRSRP